MYLQPLNCWTSFGYVLQRFPSGRQAEALLAGGALTAGPAPGRSGTAAPGLSATVTSRPTAAATA